MSYDLAMAQGAPNKDRARREFLSCRLGDETYGVDILKVQEIREVGAVTRVPRVSPFVRGVINLRGAIVPIVDLGLMLGFPAPLEFADASAIVLNVDRRLVGLIVASVSDVIGLAEDEIVPAPEMSGRAVGAAIEGIGMREGADASAAHVLLLDVDYLMRRIREERE
ncbi:MAG: chemotaxis protein CheW [Usitatibacter sp.]